jgi:hypothetical protein
MDMVHTAVDFVDRARDENIVLRLLGATAFYTHCPGFQYLGKQMGRIITDIDFAAYERQRDTILGFFNRPNLHPIGEQLTILLPRLIFREDSGLTIDVFLNRLEMCHTIEFSNRLEVDYPTIPLADLLLEKLQIVRITEKDIKDVIMLLREHKLGSSDKETIDMNYISGLLSNDWGFYHTVLLNLDKVRTLSSRYDALTDNDRHDIDGKITVLVRKLEESPKSLKWKMRAKVGESRKWYRDVEELHHSEA